VVGSRRDVPLSFGGLPFVSIRCRTAVGTPAGQAAQQRAASNALILSATTPPESDRTFLQPEGLLVIAAL